MSTRPHIPTPDHGRGLSPPRNGPDATPPATPIAGEPDEPGAMGELVEELAASAHGRRGVRLSDVIARLGGGSLMSVVLALGLAVVSPLSGIPLFSSFCGILIALTSAQLLLRRKRIWLPPWALRRKLEAAQLQRSASRMRRAASWLDSHSRARLTFLIHPHARDVVLSLCLLCGLAMPFLELVPFSSSILGAGVALLALSQLVGDGLFALLGLGLVALGGVIGYSAAGSLAAMAATMLS